MQAAIETDILQVPQTLEGLPADRSQWPADAAREYNRLLRELNSWSRDHDWPLSGNSWIAEEALRRSW